MTDTPPGPSSDKAASEISSPPPPPGLLSPDKAKENTDEQKLINQVEDLNVNGGVRDAPDPSLKSTGLRDSGQDIQTQTVNDTPYNSAKNFEDLGISKELLDGLYSNMKFERPSRVQGTTLPMILTPPFTNLIAQAHNGSGKTTCFVLAMLSRVDVGLTEPQALCLCPTRELVIQNLGVVRKMGAFTKITSTSSATAEVDGVLYGRISHQVVIGTMGTLKKWMTRRMLPVRNMKVLVLDEADNMLEANAFASDSFRMIRDIRRQSPGLQLLLFSATFNETIKEFALKVTGNEANQVFVAKENLSLDVIKQYRVVVATDEAKYTVLKDMIFPNCEKLGQTIIFVRTRESARVLHARLTEDGNTCTAISGEMQHEDRDRVIKEFREGVTRILVSTDVLSRGFDVEDVTLVVNYDVPTERGFQPAFETYLHRIGRSGRFGRKGAAFNLIASARDASVIDQIAEYFKREIPEVKPDDEDQFIEVLKKAGLTEG